MEDLFASLTEELAAWVTSVTGAAVTREDFRLPRREGQLSLGTFARGDASGAAQALTNALDSCADVKAVRAEGGWLLFFLSDGWFEKLIFWTKALPTRPTGSYLENRMAILMRRGPAPCPREEGVRRALWAALLAFRRGRWRADEERLALTMTHGRQGMERIDLENRCGSVAEAILKMRGDKL